MTWVFFWQVLLYSPSLNIMAPQIDQRKKRRTHLSFYILSVLRKLRSSLIIQIYSHLYHNYIYSNLKPWATVHVMLKRRVKIKPVRLSRIMPVGIYLKPRWHNLKKELLFDTKFGLEMCFSPRFNIIWDVCVRSLNNKPTIFKGYEMRLLKCLYPFLFKKSILSL